MEKMNKLRDIDLWKIRYTQSVHNGSLESDILE